MTSALQGELETLKLTHKHGADVDLWDLEGKTAIMHAVIGENKECVEYLLDAGQADVDSLSTSSTRARFTDPERRPAAAPNGKRSCRKRPETRSPLVT